MNIIDKTISIFNPKLGAERAKFRAIEKTINAGIRSYEGATKGRRGDGWTSYNTSENANNDIQKSLKTLRDRSVHGYKNNASIFKAIRTIQNNVIGTGTADIAAAQYYLNLHYALYTQTVPEQRG